VIDKQVNAMSQVEPKAEWLYSRNGKTFGPLTAGQLRKLVVDQRLGPRDLVCRDGTDRWVAAGSLKGLFPSEAVPAETVEQVVVQPSETDLPAESNREDSQWRVFGGRFLILNLIACGVVGLIKPPPYHITLVNEALSGVRESTTRIRESIERTKSRIQEDIEEQRREREHRNGK